MKTKMKKLTSLFVVVTMLLSMVSTVFAADYKEMFWDFPENWSTEAVTAAVDNGLLQGYEGQIHADDYLTRAEMAAIIVRAFNAETTADISIYSDVDADAWYYDSIAKAVKMEAINGVGNNLMAPTANITRQEVFTMLARVLVLSSDNEEALNRFPDGNEVSDWAKDSIIAMAEKGYVNGDQNNYLNPKDYITRAEFAQFMYNTIKTYITEPGVYDAEEMQGIVVLRVGEVTLKNVSVTSDLVVGDGVMKEKVYLQDVDVNGRLLTRGGEMTLKKTTVDEGVVVKNVNGIVHFNNYRDEQVFKGIREITTATFLQRGGSGSVGDDFGPIVPAVTYTVKFVDWDGRTLGESTVSTGGDAVVPVIPTREGYTFKGWDVSIRNITADTVAVAQYDINKYTVTFYDAEDANGEKEVISEQTVNWGGAAVAPAAPSRAGYTFVGWDKDFSRITSDLDVTARYEIGAVTTYEVTFEDWDGSAISVQTVQNGANAIIPANPEREGYDFIGWDTDDDGQTDDIENIVITGALTVKPVYQIKTYTVKFYDWDGTEISVQTVNWGEAATRPADPTREGYTFIDWDTDFTRVKADLTVTAKYELGPVIKYTVTFEDAYGNVYYTQDVKEGTGATEPSEPPQKEGHTFIGWDTTFDNVTGHIVVKPVYKIHTFTVTWKDLATQEVIHEEVVDWGTDATVPEAPEVEGHNFDGWSFDESTPHETAAVMRLMSRAATTSSFSVTNVRSDLIIWASYKIKVFTVTFIDDNGVYHQQQVEWGGRAISPENPSKDGHTFVGWGNVDLSNITSDVTVTAQFEEGKVPTHTVVFCDDNGDIISVQTVKEGEAAIPPANPSKDGHTFDGWSEDFSVITESMDVIAEYNANEHTVTFIDWDGTTTEVTVIEGESVTPPEDPTRDGHTFTGWDKDFSNVKSDIEVHATYERGQVNTYKVTFKNWDGSIYTEQTVKEGEGAITPAVPLREGYTFISWDKNFSNITSDTEIKPIYRINKYTVTFLDKDGGEISVQENVNWGKSAIAPEPPVVQGYTFVGWDKDFSRIVSDLTVKARYEEQVNVYTVTFMDRNKVISVQKVMEGESAITPANPVRQGYTFVGWDIDYSRVTSDLTVNAVYEQGAVPTYKVVFVDWDGSIYAEQTVREGADAISPAEPTRVGYTFVGWDADITNVTSTVVVFAKYQINTYTVTFKDWDGTELSVQTVNYGENATAPEDPTREGYTFTGWDIDFTNVTGDLTVTAQYVEGIAPQTYTVKFYRGYKNPEHMVGKDVELSLSSGETTVYVPANRIPEVEEKTPVYDKRDISPLYTSEADVEYVAPEFWYVNSASGELERFNENTPIKGDTDVYLLYKELSVSVKIPSLTSVTGGLSARYDENSRLAQSAIAMGVSFGGLLDRAQSVTQYQDFVDVFYSKLTSTGFVDNAQNIKMVDIPIKIATLITRSSTEGMVREYLQTYEPANEDAIMNSPYFATLMDEVNNEALDDFAITSDNLEVVKAFSKAIEYNLTYDDAMSYGNAAFVQQFADLVGEATIRERFDKMKIDFCRSIEAMATDIENGASDDRHTTFLHIRINPIDDVLVTFYETAQDKIQSAVQSKAELEYNNNIYLQHLVEDNMIAALLNHNGTESDELTGYSLKEIPEYYDYVLATAVILDDALCYYEDKIYLSNVQIGDIYDAAYGKIVDVNDKLTDLINQVETTLTDAPPAIAQILDLAKQLNDILIDVRENINDLIGSNVDFGPGNNQLQKVQDILFGREEPRFNVDSLFAFFEANKGAIQGKLQQIIAGGQISSLLDKIVNSPIGEFFDENAKDAVCDILDNIAANGVDYYRVDTSDNVTIPDKFEFPIGSNKVTVTRSYRY